MILVPVSIKTSYYKKITQVVLALSFAFLFVLSTKGEDIYGVGTPYIQQHSKAEYKAGNQNWGINSIQNGILYAANTEGLLEYDGHFWNLYTLPNKSIVRSVATNKDGRIYTGGYAEFGYWEPQDFGHLQYHSLTSLLGNPTNEEIWRIVVQKDRVIFQSFATLFIYQNNSIQIIQSDEPLLFIHDVNGRIFLEKISTGLFELKNEELVPIEEGHKLAGKSILSMLPYTNNEILVGTAKDGLYKLSSDGMVRKWEIPANHFLKENQLNNGIKINEHSYAYGTILKGIVIINDKGEIVQHLYKANGLQNNTVLSLALDSNKNIWAGLDNGIDRIEINSPFNFYTDNTGLIGTVYTSKLYKDNLYIGTNQGLFYSPWPKGKAYQEFKFTLIENTQGQVWDLSVIDNQLLCGHNNGTFKITGDKAIQLTTSTGGWKFRPLREHKNLMIQGTYNGLIIFEKDTELKFKNKIEGFNDPVRFIELISDTLIWVSGYKELKLLTLNSDFSKVIAIDTYNKNNGLPSSKFINVLKLGTDILFATDAGFYKFDKISNTFFPFTTLNHEIGTFAFSNNIINAEKDKYWFISKSKIALLDFKNAGNIKIDSLTFTSLNKGMMKDYENINQLIHNTFLVCLDNGFAIYHPSSFNNQKKSISQPLFRRIEIFNDSMDLYERISFSKESTKIDYKNNNIRFNYALPWHNHSPIYYQFYLEGYSKDWSPWSETPYKEFNNLYQGNYTFKIRAFTPDGKTSGINSFEFVVLPPWYFSWSAYLMYLFILIGLGIAINRWYSYKIIKHRELVQKNMVKQQRALLEKEAQKKEELFVKLKNEHLESDLAAKKKELTSAAMNMVYVNDLLDSIAVVLKEIKSNKDENRTNELLKKINKIVSTARSNERDWSLFERSFNETHEDFFKKLKMQFPDLSPNDLKLCTYLRMNMTSKEIASMLNITTRGIEIRRYRLRRKLDLDTKINLTEFLMNL